MQDAWSELWKTGLRSELIEVLEILEDRTRRVTRPLEGALKALPFRLHATYALDEVFAALDVRNKKGGITRIQTGGYYYKPLRTDLLFVTLEKSESEFSPTTMYRDYPLSPHRFHWETRSDVHEDTQAGQRFVTCTRGSDNHVVLFVRQRRKDARGLTMPYVFLGPCYIGSHRGERPMQVEWDLEHGMPAVDFQEFKVAAG